MTHVEKDNQKTRRDSIKANVECSNANGRKLANQLGNDDGQYWPGQGDEVLLE